MKEGNEKETFSICDIQKIYNEAYTKGFNDAVMFIADKIKRMSKGESNA